MSKTVFLIFPFLLHAGGPFDAPPPKSFNLSVFETKRTPLNEKASQNEKIVCRYVCDKKIYKEQEIGDAISFYKKSKEYKFKSLY